MKTIVYIVLILLSINLYSQNKSFTLADTNVEIGDSCYVYPLFILDGGYPLSSESIKISDSIRDFLNNNPTVAIEIQSHTDCRPIPMTNDTLSLRRSKILKITVLEDSNIDADRIIAVGCGDRNPRIVTKNIHEKYPFLPVGQVLTEEFIREVKDRQQKEFAHSLNRRTLIKVVKK